MKRTLKLAALALLLTAAASAKSPWEGVHGDLTVYCVPVNNSMFGMQLGPGTSVYEVFLGSTDPAVTAFRVSLTYTDAKGDHSSSLTVSALAPVPGYWVMAPFFDISPNQIKSVTITEMKDGATQSFAADMP